MQGLITAEARDRILQLAADRDIYITPSHDQNGDPFWIIEGWGDVNKLCEFGADRLEDGDLEEGYTAEEAIKQIVKEYPDLDWLLGDQWGFSDEYHTCDNCMVAIHLYDAMPQYWLDQLGGQYYCADCIRTDEAIAEDYLTYCASSWQHGDVGQEIAYRDFANPLDHGWVQLNDPNDEGGALLPHTDFVMLNYASDEEMQRLYKAQRAIDDNLLILAQYGKYSTSFVYWAKFGDTVEEEISADPLVLAYAISRVMAKWRDLYRVTIVREVAA